MKSDVRRSLTLAGRVRRRDDRAVVCGALIAAPLKTPRGDLLRVASFVVTASSSRLIVQRPHIRIGPVIDRGAHRFDRVGRPSRRSHAFQSSSSTRCRPIDSHTFCVNTKSVALNGQQHAAPQPASGALPARAQAIADQFHDPFHAHQQHAEQRGRIHIVQQNQRRGAIKRPVDFRVERVDDHRARRSIIDAQRLARRARSGGWPGRSGARRSRRASAPVLRPRSHSAGDPAQHRAACARQAQIDRRDDCPSTRRHRARR